MLPTRDYGFALVSMYVCETDRAEPARSASDVNTARCHLIESRVASDIDIINTYHEDSETVEMGLQWESGTGSGMAFHPAFFTLERTWSGRRRTRKIPRASGACR